MRELPAPLEKFLSGNVRILAKGVNKLIPKFLMIKYLDVAKLDTKILRSAPG